MGLRDEKRACRADSAATTTIAAAASECSVTIGSHLLQSRVKHSVLHERVSAMSVKGVVGATVVGDQLL